jgi:oxygen-independent coproporphyrinogen-3 oxidase
VIADVLMSSSSPVGFNFIALPPLALYVHMPWCLHKCPYCDFNSYARSQRPIPESDYIEQLIADFEHELSNIDNRALISVFIGGGTPSLFSAHALGRLIAHVQAHITLAPDCEITLEANPGAVEARQLREFLDIGVTRLSLGVQSFADAQLRHIGRIHSAAEARLAAEAAIRAGFHSVNIDLMYGLPGQSASDALRDVSIAVDVGATHISHYQLTIEPGTPFSRHCPVLPEEDAIADMQEECEAQLLAAGFRHYETSAYAQDGHVCRHNLNYWCFGDYLGVGAGAHGKLTDLRRQTVTRTVKQGNPQRYLACTAVGDLRVECRHLDPQQVTSEFMINVLRLVEGVPCSLFVRRTGLPVAVIEAIRKDAQARGLMETSTQEIRPTALGRRFLSDLQMLFV